MGRLFDHLTDHLRLHEAWTKVRRNRGTPGGDGVTLADFEHDVGGNLGRLAYDLRVGSYQPGPLRRLDILKRSGGVRGLAIPCVVDRVAQTSAAMVLSPILEAEFEESSFGYRPGRSVRMAVDRVSALRRQGFEWVVDADIEAYFDNVPHGSLMQRLGAHVEDRQVADLVALWLESFGGGRGLAQGSPLSPLLANLYLDEIDERIEDKGVRIVRFADDFLLLCRNEARAKGALERVVGLLGELGLELNVDKTRIVSFDEGVRFLGKLFVRSVVVDSEEEDAAAAGFDRVVPLAGTLAPGASRAPPPGVTTAAPHGDGLALPEHSDTPVVVPFPELRPPPEPVPAAEAPIEEADDRFRPFIAPLYVFEPGRELGLRNEAFSVSDDGVELLALPPGKLDRIELGPHVTVTTTALRQAVAHGVPVHLVDGHGTTVGVVSPRLERRAGLHLAQAAHVLDPDKRTVLARIIVDGRLRNQQVLLKRLNQRRKDPAVAAAAEALKLCWRSLRRPLDIDQVLDFEGQGGQHYWPALGRCLEHGWRLSKRERRPAPDAANAVLNWLSSMLTRDVHALCQRHGLHPGFGILHGTRAGHDGCAYDLVEEFRAPLAEGLAVYLFNNRYLDADDFHGRGAEGVRVTGTARGTIVRSYESWLDREIKSPRRKRKTTWRGLIDEQVGALVRHMVGEETYVPYRMDY